MKQSLDHDLLIELRTEVANIRNDIRELKDNTTSRVIQLERDKADRKEVEELQKKVNEDIDIRVRTLESSKGLYFNTMIIGSTIMAAMTTLIIYHILQK